MKKIIAILALATSGLVFADSVTIESAKVRVVDAQDQQQLKLSVKHDFSKNLTGDVSITQTQTDVTNAIGNRLEAALTPSFSVAGLNAYTRVAVGQKTSNTTAFAYYSVEPGVTAPVGLVNVKVGYRFRTAIDSGLNADTTHTQRVGVSYPLSKSDTVGMNYDRVRGDAQQNVTALNYTHSF
jgi:hypothetical protein